MSNMSISSVPQPSHDQQLRAMNLLQQKDDLEASIETLWAINSIVLVFIMQIGFAFLESGSVRIINRKSTLLKNFIDVSITIIAWVVCGSYVARGELGYGRPEENSVVSARRLFDVMFACSTATIISGSVTERISIFGYLIIIVVVSAVIYPAVVFWVWTDHGFLARLGYVDFAGSSVVHVVGGVVGIVCAWRLGPRRFGVPEAWALPTKDTPQIGLEEEPSPSSSTKSTRSWNSRRKKLRSDKGPSTFFSETQKKQKNNRAEKLLYVLEERVKFIERSQYGITTSCPITRFSRFDRPDLDVKEFQGNSPAFTVLGTLMLWFGFYGFNAGSASISGHSAGAVVRVMWNTTVAAVGGQCAALVFCLRLRLRPRPRMWFVMDPDIISCMCNATLAGLASICAGSNRDSEINAFITGLVGGMLHFVVSAFLKWCRIDDPLDAGAVHFGGGTAGCLLCGLLPQPDIGLTGRTPVFPIQLTGIATITFWSAGIALLVVEILRRLNVLRVSTALEDDGFDVWLQQSILPPPAPDVLMQLPELRKKDGNPWQVGSSGGAKVEALVGWHHMMPNGSSHAFDKDRSTMPGTKDSTSSTSSVQENWIFGEAHSGVLEQVSIEETDASKRRTLNREEQADLDYASYQASIEEEYEKELMAMCFAQEADIEQGDVESTQGRGSFAQEADIESTQSRDADTSECESSGWSNSLQNVVSNL